MEETKNFPNKLAVFEHVSQKKRSSSKRYGRANTSDSDSDTQTEVKSVCKKRKRGVRLTQEPLHLMCMWLNCTFVSENYDEFIKHISDHVPQQTDDTIIHECVWSGCNFTTDELTILSQHLVYHGYMMRLKVIGQNVLKRFDLPDCIHSSELTIPIFTGGLVCEWKYCNMVFGNVYIFFNHMKQHVNCFPKVATKNEIIECQWIGCSFKCPTQYKLADHLRSHSKERTVACPTCDATFLTKTKFYDHRKRQLPFQEQNYQCSQCTKMYPSERLLKDHIRSHVNHYKCPLCDMTCPKPSSLATHIRYRHVSERPVACSLCEFRCVSKQDLMQHLLVHCSKDLFECEECDFSCRSLHGLDRHYQKVHGQEWTQKYECHVCKKQFSRGNILTNHFIKKHGFNWPSGHSRFRYREDSDGIYRLQTVRYESLEVTQEIINSSKVSKIVTDTNYKLIKQEQDKYEAVKDEPKNNVLLPTNNSVLITINDVDEKGNILNSEIIESSEVKLLKSETKSNEELMHSEIVIKSEEVETEEKVKVRTLRPRKK